MTSTTSDLYSDDAQAGGGIAIVEGIAGVVAIVLTILGLAHVAPILLVAIATIAAGVGLVLRGASTASEIQHLLAEKDVPQPATIGGSNWAIEFLAGGAGIVLGILALLQVAPSNLVAIAVIAFGGALILTSQSTTQVNLIKLAGNNDRSYRVLAGLTAGSAGMQAVIGLQAIVLGILALAGFSPVVLVLIALLALGSFILLDGAAISNTLFAMFRR